MSKLFVINSDGDEISLDEFYKSMMFQHIMDGGFTRNERDVLLVIFRKTIHFDKWDDRLAIHHFAKLVGFSQDTLKKTLKMLEAKNLIEIERSKGGRSKGNIARFNKYSISKEFMNMVYSKWLQIKEEYGFI